MPLKSKRTFHIWKKMLLAGLIFAGLCGGFVAGTNLWMWKSASPYIDTEEEPADSGPKDCILVLGAGVYENNQPSPMLKERLDQAIVLYENHVSDKIIVSGDHNKTDYDVPRPAYFSSEQRRHCDTEVSYVPFCLSCPFHRNRCLWFPL